MRLPSRCRSGTRGFGLLEALVALVVLSTSGLALFAWMNTNLDAASRVQARQADQQALALASAWVQNLDPVRTPTGETELAGPWRVRWQATARTPWADSAPLPGGSQTPFRLALFEVDVVVLDANARERLRFVAQRLGAQRQPDPEPMSDS